MKNVEVFLRFRRRCDSRSRRKNMLNEKYMHMMMRLLITPDDKLDENLKKQKRQLVEKLSKQQESLEKLQQNEESNCKNLKK